MKIPQGWLVTMRIQCRQLLMDNRYAQGREGQSQEQLHTPNGTISGVIKRGQETPEVIASIYEILLCSRSSSMLFTCTNSFNLPNNITGCGHCCHPHFTDKETNPERLNHLPKATRPQGHTASNESRSWTQLLFQSEWKEDEPFLLPECVKDDCGGRFQHQVGIGTMPWNKCSAASQYAF